VAAGVDGLQFVERQVSGAQQPSSGHHRQVQALLAAQATAIS
jgi:hypothetical protein